ncbi:MAG: hypothetical protein ACI8ZN_002802 [Bacteroidia bacterium]|jgi:hypothetical protein
MVLTVNAPMMVAAAFIESFLKNGLYTAFLTSAIE